MSYVPSKRKSIGSGKHYYLVCTSDGKTKINTIWISGKLLKAEKGTFRDRRRKLVKGVRLTYENYLKSTIGRRGRLRGSSIPLKIVHVRRVIPLPQGAEVIGIYTMESLPEQYKSAVQKVATAT